MRSFRRLCQPFFAWYVLPLFVAAMVVFQSGLSHAATETITNQVTGIGDTRKEAITAALVEGIKQVGGVMMKSSEELKTAFSAVVSQNENLTNETFALTTTQKERIFGETEGYVSAYRVLSLVYEPENKEWKAVLLVDIPRYLAPGQDRSRLRTMAVLPFRNKGSADSSASNISDRLNQKLIAELTQARKFRVLERHFMAEFLSEQKFLKSGELPIAETLRLGQQLGADYLLVGNIVTFDIKEIQDVTLGVKSVSWEVTMNFDYQVIELATQEIRWSDTYNLVPNERRLQEFLKSDDDLVIREAVLSYAANTVITKILDVIFPIKVLAAEAENWIYLNQGGLRISPGERIEIFTPGRVVIDPDTGLKIRVDGPWVATVEISRVLPKFSVAKVIEGTYKKIVERAICRRLNPTQSLSSEKEVKGGTTVNY